MQQPISPLPTLPAVPPTLRKLGPVAHPPRPSRRKLYLWLVMLAGMCGAGYWLFQRNLAEEAIASRRAALSAIRTATVGGGNVLATLRLTGTTGPEKYSTILGPQLRGSRSFQGGGGGGMMGRGPTGGGGGSQSAAVSSVQSNSSGASSSMGGSVVSSSASADPSGGGGGAGASVGGVRSASGALKATTSRISASGSARSTLSSAGTATQSSATMGDGTGSTASALQGANGSPGGGGGGGGGMSDFGAILQDLVKPGAHIKKNDKVAEFDRQFMLQRLEDYRSGVLQQELNLTRQVADIDVRHKAHDQQVNVAKADWEKALLDLKTIPVRSAIDTERYKLAVEEAEAKYKQVLTEEPYVKAGDDAQVKIAEMTLQQSKLELRRSEQNADRMVVRAPLAGMAVMMQMFRGTEFGQVQSGDPISPGMPFMQVVDPNSMIVNAAVNQVDVEKIRVGSKAIIHFDAFPDLEVPGHVFSVAAMPRATNGARASYLKEIPVRIKLDRMDPRVIPDLSVSIDVIVQEEQASAVVPKSAVFQDSPGAPRYVWVKVPTGWDRREVTLGVASNHHVSVRSGVSAGDVVAEERPPQPAAAGKASSS